MPMYADQVAAGRNGAPAANQGAIINKAAGPSLSTSDGSIQPTSGGILRSVQVRSLPRLRSRLLASHGALRPRDDSKSGKGGLAGSASMS